MRRPDISLIPEIDSTDAAMEDRVLDRIIGGAVWAASAQLTPPQRTAFWHVYAEDRSIREVAVWMGLSQTALKGLLHRAKVNLSQSPILNSAPI